MSRITDIFSRLIIPLGEIPPRNLNVMNRNIGGLSGLSALSGLSGSLDLWSGDIRSRVSNMENLTDYFNAAITALENGTAPEERNQYINANERTTSENRDRYDKYL